MSTSDPHLDPLHPLARLREGPYGLYLEARRPMSRGEVVFQLEGREVSEPNQHTIQLEEGLHYGESKGIWHLIQHACIPNLRFDIGELAMIAVREIKVGEELNYNYNTSEWSLSAPFSCACGLESCVGEVRGFAHLSSDERAQIRPLLTPYLQSRMSVTV